MASDALAGEGRSDWHKGRGGGAVSPVLIDIRAVSAMLGRSESSIRRDHEAGRMPAPVTLGASRRWRRGEIKAWVRAGCPSRADWEGRWPNKTGLNDPAGRRSA